MLIQLTDLDIATGLHRFLTYSPQSSAYTSHTCRPSGQHEPPSHAARTPDTSSWVRHTGRRPACGTGPTAGCGSGCRPWRAASCRSGRIGSSTGKKKLKILITIFLLFYQCFRCTLKKFIFSIKSVLRTYFHCKYFRSNEFKIIYRNFNFLF